MTRQARKPCSGYCQADGRTLTRACRHSSERDRRAHDVNHTHTAFVGFLVSGCYPAEFLGLAEEVLDILPWIHRAFSLLKRWSFGTYHGSRRKHVDTYLNEFVVRYNRRFYYHVSFETLLGLAAHHVPANYWDIVNQVNPRKGARTIRLAPRRRKTATGMRQDGVTPELRTDHDRDIGQVDPLHVDEPGTARISLDADFPTQRKAEPSIS